MKFIYLTIFMLISVLGFTQTINKIDANKNRHGIWKKNFEGTNVLRYEGEFYHGKEKGMFKFYLNIDDKSVLSATKEFSENDNNAFVKFYTSNGKLISEGQMDGKTYIGEWKYYQNDSDKLFILEHYNNQGELDGERFVYYPSGVIAEKQNYLNGVLNGFSFIYSENNIVLNEYDYKDGKLDGVSKVYNTKGDLTIEGAYKQGQKQGMWKYYEEGRLIEEKDFNIPLKSQKE